MRRRPSRGRPRGLLVAQLDLDPDPHVGIDIRRIGRELGVRYLLEGSVRKAGARLRITGQLIEAETRAHLWADKFDSVLEDVFDLQDRVTMAVAGAIEPSVTQAEIKRANRKPTESLQAYDWLLRAR